MQLKQNKSLLIIMLTMLTSKVFGFSRDLISSYIYGTSRISDYYIVATTIPNVFFGFLLSSINTCFIPAFKEIELHKGKKKADDFTNNIVFICFIICLLFIVITYCTIPLILKLFGYNSQQNDYKIISDFLAICIWQIIFNSIGIIFGSYLQSKGKFNIQSLSGIPLDIALIVSYLVANKFGIYYLAFGFVFAYFIQCVFYFPFLKLFHYKLSFLRRKIISIDEKNFLKMAIPVILSVSITQINNFVDKIIATRVTVGGISAVNYAHKLELLIEGIFVTSIVTVIYPSISQNVIEKNINALSKQVDNAISMIFALVLPITVVGFILAEPLVELLFERGAFDHRATIMTSVLFKYYLLGIFATGIREIISRVYYARKMPYIPTKNSMIGMIINIILNVILSQLLGLKGLAIATSISLWITALLMIFSLKKSKELVEIVIIKILKSNQIFIISSAVMGVCCYIMYTLLPVMMSLLLRNVSIVLVSALVYFGIVVGYFVLKGEKRKNVS